MYCRRKARDLRSKNSIPPPPHHLSQDTELTIPIPLIPLLSIPWLLMAIVFINYLKPDLSSSSEVGNSFHGKTANTLPRESLLSSSLSHCTQTYRIMNGTQFFPAGIFVPEQAVRHHNSHSHILKQPFCKTTRFMSSFVPSAISLWNALDSEVVSCPNITSFKSLLSQYF